MRFEATGIDGALRVVAESRTDARGAFGRVFCVEEFAAAGLDTTVAQMNVAITNHAGTVRGLHYQLPPSSEAKLLRCTRGSVLDVIVDTRSGSPTFGTWISVRLAAGDGKAIYVPPGCAHGYQSLEDDSEVLYHASAAYDPDRERGIYHGDPDLGIAWTLPPTHVSEKDSALPNLADAVLTTG